MNHTHHHKEMPCSCCSPLWKSLIPELPLKEVTKQLSKNESSETLIFRTGTNPDNSGDQKMGYIQTMANGQDVMVEAIGIKDSYIVATGDYEYVKGLMPQETAEKIIYGGQTLLPGFFDPHMHILPTAAFNLATDVGPFIGQELRTKVANDNEDKYTKEWVIKTLKQEAEEINQLEGKEENTWIFGKNVDPSLMVGEDKEFNVSSLNEVSTDYPVFVMNASMHLAYVNHKAIEFAGNNDLILPSDGILKELKGIDPVLKLIGESIGSETLLNKLSDSVDDLFHEAGSRGVTYIIDAAVDPDEAAQQVQYLKKKAYHNCPVRIGGALIAPTLEDFNKNIEGKYSPNEGDDRFNLPFVKLVSDGSNQGLTGYQYAPYECDENYDLYASKSVEDIPQQKNVGLFNYDPVEFDRLIDKAVNAKWPLMIHSNGRQAIDRTISAFKKAGIDKSLKEARRDRIEHASLLTDENLSDMDTLGISPSFLIGHVGYWGWAFQQTILGSSRASHLDRCGSAIQDYDMRISMHSDNSVTPLGPLRMMEQAITRIMEGAPQELESQVLNQAERITRFQALKAMTYDAAWQCHADQWAGSLEKGKCADFVLLEENPLTYSSKTGVYSASGMRNISVLETWKGGKKVYSAKDEIKDNSPLRAESKVYN